MEWNLLYIYLQPFISWAEVQILLVKIVVNSTDTKAMEKVAVLTIQWSTQVPWKLRSAIETCSFVLFKGIFKATEKDNTLFQGIIQTPEQVKKKKKKKSFSHKSFIMWLPQMH